MGWVHIFHFHFLIFFAYCRQANSGQQSSDPPFQSWIFLKYSLEKIIFNEIKIILDKQANLLEVEANVS